jgi:hypothetical protein
MTDVKQAVQTLFDMAKDRTVRFPKGSDWNDSKVKQTCGATLLAMPKKEDGSFDVDAALTTLVDQYGVEKESEADKKKRKAEEEAEDAEDDDEEGGSPSKGKKPKKEKGPPKRETVVVEANRAVAYAFQEMADLYFKNGERMKGGAFSKVRTAAGVLCPPAALALIAFLSPCPFPFLSLPRTPGREGDPRGAGGAGDGQAGDQGEAQGPGQGTCDMPGPPVPWSPGPLFPTCILFRVPSASLTCSNRPLSWGVRRVRRRRSRSSGTRASSRSSRTCARGRRELRRLCHD